MPIRIMTNVQGIYKSMLRNKSVNAVYGNNCCFFSDPHKTREYNMVQCGQLPTVANLPSIMKYSLRGNVRYSNTSTTRRSSLCPSGIDTYQSYTLKRLLRHCREINN